MKAPWRSPPDPVPRPTLAPPKPSDAAQSVTAPSTRPWKGKQRPAYVEQERKQAKRKGARAQRNSGRLWHSLRDVVERSVIGHLLIDNKTGKDGPLKSYRLTAGDWDELKRDANRTPPGCYPVLRIDLGRHRLMVIEESMWDDVGEMLSEYVDIDELT